MDNVTSHPTRPARRRRVRGTRPPESLAAKVRSYIDVWPIDTVANSIGCSESTVMALGAGAPLYRATLTLAERWAASMPDEPPPHVETSEAA